MFGKLSKGGGWRLQVKYPASRNQSQICLDGAASGFLCHSHVR
jgi:hypothetical protein